MEKDITICYENDFLNFTTLEWKSDNDNSIKLVSILEMSSLIQWLEKENTSSKRVKCKKNSDLILFRNPIKYVRINE